jgi:hypothetical protein
LNMDLNGRTFAWHTKVEASSAASKEDPGNLGEMHWKPRVLAMIQDLLHGHRVFALQRLVGPATE